MLRRWRLGRLLFRRRRGSRSDMPVRGRDPRVRAVKGAYMTDGTRLVQVIESTYAAALLQDQKTFEYINADPKELMQLWRPVTPAQGG